jgi:NTE family protein
MDVAALLAQSPVFADLGPRALHGLAALATRVELRSGQCLYEEGGTPEYFYFLVSGRLRVHSGERLVGYIGRMEPVGEMGMISGSPHAASVHAIRDTVLLKFERQALLVLLQKHAPTLLALTRLMLGRMREYQGKRQAITGGHGTVALVPVAQGVNFMELARALLKCWGDWPQARLITAKHVDAALGADASQTPFDDAEGSQRLSQWLHEMENCHRYLIYVADNAYDVWALRCLRHADRVLLVAEAAQPPGAIPVLQQLPEPLLAPVELVLLRPHGDPSPHTQAWRQVCGARAHYFVHPWSATDLGALAAQVTGRGVGLVLGGGGARGFAHIGLIRALEQLHIPVHVMGGTSMGAFIAALMACDYDSVEITHITRETFVNNNYLNDYTLPRVSLIEGRRFMHRLADIFGDQQIEDLRRSYYCISTSLTTGAAVIHDHGTAATWVGTSMAVPGIAPPIAYKGQLLVDGGVVDNLPTDVMQGLERGSIIASSVSSKGDIIGPSGGGDLPDPYAMLQRENRQNRPGFREILLRTATLTSDTVVQRESARRADVYISMPVSGVGLMDWKHMDMLIERGYRHALEQLAPVRDSLIGITKEN